MTNLETLQSYLQAVELRKPLDKQNCANIAVVMQLEEDDIPRLIRIIRELVVSRADEVPDGVATLAKEGSKARWGEYVRSESNKGEVDLPESQGAEALPSVGAPVQPGAEVQEDAKN